MDSEKECEHELNLYRPAVQMSKYLFNLNELFFNITRYKNCVGFFQDYHDDLALMKHHAGLGFHPLLPEFLKRCVAIVHLSENRDYPTLR